MAYYPWNSQVTVRGMRGNPSRAHYARDIKVQIEQVDATNPGISQDQAAVRWRYMIKWNPKDTLDDGSRISEGDVMLWDVYPGQELAIGDVFFDPGATFINIHGYFMPVDTSGPNAA